MQRKYLDKEWIDLILSAFELGLKPEDIKRNFKEIEDSNAQKSIKTDSEIKMKAFPIKHWVPRSFE